MAVNRPWDSECPVTPPANPPTGLRSPRPWQTGPIRWAEEPSRRQAAFFLDKRLGKIKLAVHWALARNDRLGGFFLVVAPKSAIPDWLTDLEAEGQPSLLLSGLPALEQVRAAEAFTLRGNCSFSVVNPEALFNAAGRGDPCSVCSGVGTVPFPAPAGEEQVWHDCTYCGGLGRILRKDPLVRDFALLPWAGVVWDESTNLANPKSQLNRVAHACFFECPNRAILSGEPAPEGPFGLFEQFRWCFGSFMGRRNFWAWRDENFKLVGYDWIPKPGALAAIKAEVSRLSFSLTRVDAGVGEHWEKQRRFISLPPKVRKAYDKIESDWEHEASDPEDVKETKFAVVAAEWLMQLCSGVPREFPKLAHQAKLDQLVDDITGEFSGRQLVVLFRRNSELEAALSLLQKKGVRAQQITGKTPVLERKRLQACFLAGHFRVLLLQARVGRFGINLSAADTLLRFSLPADYETISQSRDRIVDPARKRVLLQVDYIVQDSVEQDLHQTLAEKGITARYFISKLRQRFERRVAAKGAPK